MKSIVVASNPTNTIGRIILKRNQRKIVPPSAVDRFEKTNSIMDFDLVKIELPIAPGEYELLIELMDLDTRKTGYQKMDIDVPDYAGSLFHVSQMLLADTVILISMKNRLKAILVRCICLWMTEQENQTTGI